MEENGNGNGHGTMGDDELAHPRLLLGKRKTPPCISLSIPVDLLSLLYGVNSSKEPEIEAR